ncbi:MAG: 6-phosphofructokinase [Bacilli bacterium]|nr:6-phosphofructokinase [Bacilli bacterium]
MVKKIAILTSGGDAPGMNAAIRAVVRAGRINGLEVYGIRDGYRGLYEGGDNFQLMSRKSVTDIIARGGTILGSARLPEFKDPAYRQKGIENLKKLGIDCLIVIGGDGTYTGANALKKDGVNVIGLPGTIDNDIYGTDYTIGFDTCINTVVDAIDRLRDTCGSHERCAVVEVMGRYCGDVAKAAGLATGAEFVITSDTGLDLDYVLEKTKDYKLHSKRHPIIIVTEHITNVHELAKKIEDYSGFETRATVLGHIQRGGKPSTQDRILASRLGLAAVEYALAGKFGVCLGIVSNEIVSSNFEDVLGKKKHVFRNFEKSIEILS